MTSSDSIKLAVILPLFFGLGPALGVAIKDRPVAQRILFGLMCFMTINGLFAAGNWGLTLASVEKYRGHAKGYHFYFNHIWSTAGFIACAILVQSALSRAALVMFAGGTIIVALVSLLEKPTRRRIGSLASIAAVGALGLTLTLDTIVSRFSDRGNTSSAELRVVLNDAARQMVKTHPLGIGWNNYALCINPPFPYAEVVYNWTRGRNMRVDEDKPNAPVESHYFLLLGENGYPGLASWVLLISVGLWRNLRAFLSFPHGFERCLSLGIATGCTLNYVQSAYERVLTQPRNLMLWLIIFALTARLEILRRTPSPSPSPSPPDPLPPTQSPIPSPPPTHASTHAPHPIPSSPPSFPSPPWAQP